MNQQIDNNFIIEQNKIYYSENAHIYEMFSRGQNHRIKVHLQQKIASIKGGFSDFVRVLDIGAGTGFAIKTVASMFHDFRVQFVGCDISPAMLKVAKTQTGLADFVLFDGVSLPFSDRSFDIVLLVSVLHHLLDPVPLLNEAMRVLSNRGSIIILQEPNPLVNGPSRRIKRLMKALPDEKLMLAEYHQFMTDGLYPEMILNLLYENYSIVALSNQRK